MKNWLIGVILLVSSVPLWFILIAIRWESFVIVTFPEPRGEAIWAYDPVGFGIISITCGSIFLLGLYQVLIHIIQRSTR